MLKGDIWKDGGEMADYLAMSKYATDNGYLFARNADGDFEIMDMPEPTENTPIADPKDEKISALERRLEEMESVLASLIAPVGDETFAGNEEGEAQA